METRYYDDICINTILMDLPTYKVKGCTTLNEDGSYTIFLNTKFSKSQLDMTYKHELKHILNDDFAKFDVNEIELDSHE